MTPDLSGPVTAPTVLDSLFQLRGFGLAVVLALTLLSVVSWTIILGKSRLLGRVTRENRALRGELSAGASLSIIGSIESPSPLPTIIKGLLDAHHAGLPVETALHRTTRDVRAGLETSLAWLATIASVAPFLGLLGTVWGIMQAFLAIGATGSSSLSAVAPGIAAALLTTIFGLGVAIPAVVGYNHCTRHLRLIMGQLENVGSEVIDRLQMPSQPRREAPRV